jgi:hypothetical protein
MKRNGVEKLPLDQLWALYKQVKTKLSAKLEAETRMLENGLPFYKADSRPLRQKKRGASIQRSIQNSGTRLGRGRRGPVAANNPSGYAKRSPRDNRSMIS